MTSEQILRSILRIVGTASLLALPFVAVPYAWMDSIHSDLGMGSLPAEPVVGYLARSTSAFYAMLGGLFWLVSFDLRRHRKVVTYFGAALPWFGVILLVVDWWEGMPRFWTVWEGPFVIVFGLAMLFLSRRIQS